MTQIYVASSWRNQHHAKVVEALKKAGYSTYDFKKDGASFDWKELKPGYKTGDLWMPRLLEMTLCHKAAERAFDHDFKAVKEAHACVLVLPAGRSAHLEAGYIAGRGWPLFVYAEDAIEPELMYLMAGLGGNIHIDIEELLLAMRDQEVLP